MLGRTRDRDEHHGGSVFNKRKADEPKLKDEEGFMPTIPEDTSASGNLIPSSFKDTSMTRSPFAPPPIPNAGVSSGASPSPRSLMPGAREIAERRTLVVGRGISVQGTVQDAERLVVEGTVEASMVNGLVELSIAPGGVFKGEVEVDDAEIAGTIDGTLTARGTLVVRNTGRVLGTARCRRLQVEDGGQITGRIEMLSENSNFPLHSEL